MPNPKRQHSKQRGRKRRTHWKLRVPNLRTCPQCKQPTLSHRVCPFCGYYKGKLVVDTTVKQEKEKKS